MNALASEHQIAASARAGGEIDGGHLEALLGSLLSQHAGYRPGALDGVLVVQARRDAISVRARAIAILIDGQLVEPATFALLLGADGQLAPASVVQFGTHPHQAITYGTPAHHRLVNRLLAEPPQVPFWACQFTRGDLAWFRSGGVA